MAGSSVFGPRFSFCNTLLKKELSCLWGCIKRDSVSPRPGIALPLTGYFNNCAEDCLLGAAFMGTDRNYGRSSWQNLFSALPAKSGSSIEQEYHLNPQAEIAQSEDGHTFRRSVGEAFREGNVSDKVMSRSEKERHSGVVFGLLRKEWRPFLSHTSVSESDQTIIRSSLNRERPSLEAL